MKDEVGLIDPAQLEVPGQVPGIAVEIFVRPELGAIHEDTDNQ
jgi:hypothetical protein